MTTTCIYLQQSVDQQYDPKSLAYVSGHKQRILDAASSVGVSWGAIAGIMAEECDSYYSKESINVISDNYALYDVDVSLAVAAYQVGGVVGFAAYVGSLVLLDDKRTDQEWEALYIDAVNHGFSYTGSHEADKIINPVLMDMGKANFKMATAIQLITDYLASDPSDVLGVSQYYDDYAKLADDLVRDLNGIVPKLYAIMAEEAEIFFLDHDAYGDDWDGLPQEFKDALIVTYCNFGKEMMLDKYNANPAGSRYEPLPGFGTGGGMNHLANAVAIGSAMGISYGTGVVSGTSDFSQFTEGLDGYAFRYALYNLRPVALTTLDYSVRNPDGVLDDLSAQWLQDRSDMLQLKIHVDMNDLDPALQAGDVYYLDAITGTALGNPFNNVRRVVFGDTDAETLTGSDKDDRLYGLGGNDTLTGGAGNDWLEGGTGSDTYIFSEDSGHDTVADDLDGGTLSITDVELANVNFYHLSGSKTENGTFVVLDSNGHREADYQGWTLQVNGTTAVLGIRDASNAVRTITIQDFHADSNNFGLQLHDRFEDDALPTGLAADDPAEFKRLRGDMFFARLLSDGSNVADVQQEIDDYNSNETGSYYEDNYLDTALVYDAHTYGVGLDVAWLSTLFEGSSQADLLKGNPLFSDTIYGGNGDDVITGDGPLDNPSAGPSSDTLVGGRGSDAIYGNAGSDFIVAGEMFDGMDYTGHEQGTHAIMYGPGFSPAVVNYLQTYSVERALMAGVVTLEDADAVNVADGGDGHDRIYGSVATDVLLGGNGDDFLLGGVGNDQLSGGANNDVIYGDSQQRNYIYQSAVEYSLDFIAPDLVPETDDFSRANFYLDGQDMDDVYNPQTAYNDVIDGGSGTDIIFGEIGSDVINGGSEADVLFGDRTYSAGFFVNGASEAYRLEFSNSKTFQSLASQYHGDDVVNGGAGNDTIVGGGDSDVLDGGDDHDVIYGDIGMGVYDCQASQPVEGDPSQAVSASDDGWWGADYIKGGAGNDTLIGEGGNDTLSGGANDDRLYGDWQGVSDILARTGDDTLEGGAGNDTLMAGAGVDTLTGGTGDDTLQGEAGNDTLAGGSGNDLLMGGNDNDTYLFFSGDGADMLADSAGSNRLLLPGSDVRVVTMGQSVQIYYAGNDADAITTDLTSWGTLSLRTQNGETVNVINDASGSMTDVVLDGREGNDLLSAGGGNDYLQGGGGVDQLDGGSGADRLFGDDGSMLSANQGNDTLWGAAGNDTLSGDGGNDLLDGGADNDTLYGNAGIDTLNGDTGDDFLWGDWSDVATQNDVTAPTGTDVLNGGDGNDYLQGGGGADQLDGGNGADRLVGDDGSTLSANQGVDTLWGGAGNDTLSGNGGNDVLDGGADNDTLFGNAGNDELYGSDGVDYLSGDDSGGAGGDDMLYGENGNDTLWGYAGNDYLSGGADNDRLNGGRGDNVAVSGNDTLEGGAGNDTLWGEDGNDVLDGGEGFDTLNGSAGDDTYRFRYGDGGFTTTNNLDESISDSSGNTTLQFVGVTDLADLAVSFGSATALVRYSNRAIDGIYQDEIYLDAISWRNTVAIAVDSGVYSVGDFLAEVADDTANRLYGNNVANVFSAKGGDDVLFGQGGGDSLYGGSGNDYLAGDDDNDTLWGEIGKDSLYGGNGNDVLFGDVGDDRLNGDAGNDELSGGTGNDNLNGGTGNNYLNGDEGDDTLDGDAGADTLHGGAGYDTMRGGGGNDTYLFGLGDGSDTVSDNSGYDVVRFSSGVQASDVTFRVSSSGNDLLVTLADGSKLTVQAYFSGSARISEFLFHDGNGNLTSMNQVVAAALVGRNAADVIYGTAVDDVINALDGNDTVYGNAGADTVAGSAGDDTLDGGVGTDTLGGDSGNDTLLGAADIDVLLGGAGDDRLDGGAGADTLDGGSGNDSVTGGADNDLLLDSAGDDVYVGSSGDGNDVLSYSSGRDVVTVNGSDVINFASLAGLSSTAVTLEIVLSSQGGTNFNDLKVSVNGSATDSLLLRDYFTNGTGVTLSFSNATLTQSAVKNQLSTPTGGNDVIFGTASNEEFDGLAGNDTLLGRAGDDSYIFGFDYDKDVIFDAEDGVDKLCFTGDDISKGESTRSNYGNVYVSQVGYDLVVELLRSVNDLDTKSGDSATIKNYFNGGNNYVDLFFANIQGGNAASKTWSYATVLDLSNNHLEGNGVGNTLKGYGGQDVIYGMVGDDILEGGKDNDALIGGSISWSGEINQDGAYLGGEFFDNNTYLYSAGDGVDSIFNRVGSISNVPVGKLVLSGISEANTSFIRDGNDLYLSFSQGGGVRVSDWFVRESYAFFNVEHDGWIICQSATQQLAAISFSGTDKSYGYINALPFHLTAGNDSISPFARNGASTFDDLMASTYYADAGDDYVFSGALADRLYGGDGNDTLLGGTGADYLEGNAGDDVLYGAATNVMDGSIDTLIGGAGNDAYMIDADFSNAATKDVVTELAGEGIDTVVSSINLSLSGNFSNIENLTLTGNAVNGWGDNANNVVLGNTVDNYLRGFDGNDSLFGDAGNDTLDGGTGSDTLTGGAGNDVFVFAAGDGADWVTDAQANDVVDIGNPALWYVQRQDTDTIQLVSKQTATDVLTIDGAVPLLRTTNGATVETVDLSRMKDQTLSLSRSTSEDSFVFLFAWDFLGNQLSDEEKQRWQLVSAEVQSGTFGIDTDDLDGDGNNMDQTFWFVEGFFGGPYNAIGFLPAENAGAATFGFVMQRDDGLEYRGSMAVTVQDGNVLTGTTGNDILDGDQRDVSLVINGGAGDDLIRDGNADDMVYGGSGDDVLTCNWKENGNDTYYGEAGNDVLDAGWCLGTGADTLVGGSGNDLYVENNLWSGDRTVIDNRTAAAGDVDTLDIRNDGRETDYHALWFVQDGSDLLITQINQLNEVPGNIRVAGWFSGGANSEAKLDSILVKDDSGAIHTLAASGVDVLVQAMAGITQPTDLASLYSENEAVANLQDNQWQLVAST